MRKSIVSLLTAVMFLGFLVPGLNVSAYSADSYGFVNQLYEVCLERSPSSSERDYWGDCFAMKN